jgi:hypothetical protein
LSRQRPLADPAKSSHSRGGKSFERVIEIRDCGFCAPLVPLPDPDARGETRS